MNEPERKPVRVRYAPSPTGLQHIGGLRTALYNYLYARQLGGQFILRIEDTDQKRFVEGALENTIGFLRDFGLHYDEGPILLTDKDTENDSIGMLSSRYPGVYELGPHAPYIQSERLDLYQQYVDELVVKGAAYYCFCTEERLTALRERQETAKLAPRYDRECLKLPLSEVQERREQGVASVVRFKIPDSGHFTVTDILRGEINSDTAVLDDFVIMKSDGYPTYHLANVVDDHLMEITHVMRAVEWLPSLPKHILLYQVFGWEAPQFAHLSIILGKDGKKKLSKREGDVSVDSFVEAGYLREALLNFVALLGWNPGKGSTEEFFSLDGLVQSFSLEHLNKAGAVFDRTKLEWMNHEYIVRKSDNEVLTLIRSGGFLEKKDWYAKVPAAYKTDEYLSKIVALEKDRLKTLAGLGDENQFLFTDILEYPTERLSWKGNALDVTRASLEQALVLVENLPESDWERATLAEKFLAAAGEKRGDFLWPLRVALSGLEHSPSPMDILWILGRERSIARIRSAIDLLDSPPM
ncbi:MAG: glutamate--tRNA ligase [Candidatus Moraniibacteriota bacterium]